MTQKNRPKPSNNGPPTQEMLANALGVSGTLLRNLLNRDDWPFGRKGPFNLPAIAAWRAAHQRRSTPAVTPNRAAYEKAMKAAGKEPIVEEAAPVGGSLQSQFVAARIRKLDFEYKVRSGEYISRGISDGVYVGMVGMIRERISQWVDAMPSMFVGASEDRIRKLARDYWDGLCNDLYHAASMELASEQEVERVRGMKDENKVRARAVTRRGTGRRMK